MKRIFLCFASFNPYLSGNWFNDGPRVFDVTETLAIYLNYFSFYDPPSLLLIKIKLPRHIPVLVLECTEQRS